MENEFPRPLGSPERETMNRPTRKLSVTEIHAWQNKSGEKIIPAHADSSFRAESKRLQDIS
jgi:hypothetical protein